MKLQLMLSAALMAALASCNNNAPTSQTTQTAKPATSMLQSDGQALFKQHCATCHNPTQDGTGPALKGIRKQLPSDTWLYAWIKNPQALIAQKDAYALSIFEKWNKTPMTAFPNLSKADIDAIMEYVDAQ